MASSGKKDDKANLDKDLRHRRAYLKWRIETLREELKSYNDEARKAWQAMASKETVRPSELKSWRYVKQFAVIRAKEVKGEITAFRTEAQEISKKLRAR